MDDIDLLSDFFAVGDMKLEIGLWILEGRADPFSIHILLTFFDAYTEIPLLRRTLDEDLAIATVRIVRRTATKPHEITDCVHTAHRRLFYIPWFYSPTEQATLFTELDRRMLGKQNSKISQFTPLTRLRG